MTIGTLDIKKLPIQFESGVFVLLNLTGF
jgi:hypothetical protein